MSDGLPQWVMALQIPDYNHHTMNAVQIYKYLLDRFNKVDVSQDTDFQNRYKEFFTTRLSFGGDEWHALYFAFLENLKNKYRNTKPTVSDLESERDNFYNLLKSHGLNPRRETSFISKALHMINNDLAIIDKNIKAALPNIHRGATPITVYGEINTEIHRIIALPYGQEIIKQFRAAFPDEEHGISDVKIIDFYYWRI